MFEKSNIWWLELINKALKIKKMEEFLIGLVAHEQYFLNVFSKYPFKFL